MGEAGGGVGGGEKRNKMRGVRRPGLVLCSLAISGPLSVTQPYASASDQQWVKFRAGSASAVY